MTTPHVPATATAANTPSPETLPTAAGAAQLTTRQGPDVLRATWTIMVRELRPVLHDPFSVVFSLVQPLTFLLLFAPLLAGSSGVPLAQALTWFVPGVLCMIALFGTGMTGSNLLYEIQAGSHERTLVTPVPRSALIVGRALKEIVPLLGQSLVLILVAVLLGYRPSAFGTLIGLALLAVFGVGLGALSYALGLATSTTDWMFWAVQQTLLFPLMLLSGMLLPLEDGPTWMRGLAAANPLAYLVDAERTLAAGEVFHADVAQGVVASVAMLVIGLAVGLRAVRRST